MNVSFSFVLPVEHMLRKHNQNTHLGRSITFLCPSCTHTWNVYMSEENKVMLNYLFVNVAFLTRKRPCPSLSKY